MCVTFIDINILFYWIFKNYPLQDEIILKTVRYLLQLQKTYFSDPPIKRLYRRPFRKWDSAAQVSIIGEDLPILTDRQRPTLTQTLGNPTNLLY